MARKTPAGGTEHLSAGDYLILAFLHRGPTTAYELKKKVSSSVSFFWDAAHSQIYQQAKRLLRDGYIEEAAERGSRNRRPLGLTDHGRQALELWLGEPAPLWRLSDESLIKVFFGGLTGAEQTVAMLRDQLDQHRERLAEYEAIRMMLEATDQCDSPVYELFTVRLGIAVEKAWVRWVRQTIQELGSGTRG
jgi:DNA-binding PadR family transcriptional regulator